MANQNLKEDKRKSYYNSVKEIGKKEFTLLKMQEYGFWPADLPTPNERQKNETKEDYQHRQELVKQYEQLAGQIAKLYQDKMEINRELNRICQQFDQTWDEERIRKEVSKQIMQESLARREQRRQQRVQKQQERSRQWQEKKAEQILFIGKGYSGALADRNNDLVRLQALGLPVFYDDKELAQWLAIDLKELRFLAYHRDVLLADHYHRYQIPKKSGGMRTIAAPKPILKKAQRKILELILEKIPVSQEAHGFVKTRSVVTGAMAHPVQPALLMNIDLENFFPTITFARVRGMFQSLGYSGYLSSLLAMLCTDCERMEIEIKGLPRYVKCGERVLPQGSPASPMITNIICRHLDERLVYLANKHNFTYSRYADDMSFSFQTSPTVNVQHQIAYEISRVIEDEGFCVNQKKTRYLRKGSRQSVTGVVLNHHQVGVPKVWVKQLRAAVYNAKQELKSGQIPNSVPEITGMVGWLKTVNQERYQRLIIEAESLLRECKSSCQS